MADIDQIGSTAYALERVRERIAGIREAATPQEVSYRLGIATGYLLAAGDLRALGEA